MGVGHSVNSRGHISGHHANPDASAGLAFRNPQPRTHEEKLKVVKENKLMKKKFDFKNGKKPKVWVCPHRPEQDPRPLPTSNPHFGVGNQNTVKHPGPQDRHWYQALKPSFMFSSQRNDDRLRTKQTMPAVLHATLSGSQGPIAPRHGERGNRHAGPLGRPIGGPKHGLPHHEETKTPHWLRFPRQHDNEFGAKHRAAATRLHNRMLSRQQAQHRKVPPSTHRAHAAKARREAWRKHKLNGSSHANPPGRARVPRHRAEGERNQHARIAAAVRVRPFTHAITAH